MNSETGSLASGKTMGWEISEHVEKKNLFERLFLNRRQTHVLSIVLLVNLVLFLGGMYLSTNPLVGLGRIASPAVQHMASGGACIVWWVVALAVIFEFLDSAAGMGYGTAFTPLLLVLGFDPMQIVPAVMIQQAVAGLSSAVVHREMENVEWRFKPMNETAKLALIVAGSGAVAVFVSVFSAYGILKLNKLWVKSYVALLLLFMGIINIVNAKRNVIYRPKKMLFYAALAGFNKGIGGGGYGPVVTVGGLFSGVPVKAMLAVTALSEGIVCVVSIIAWFLLSANGVTIDFILLPSMLLGSMVSIVAAPYAARIVPSRGWKIIVPVYCCLLSGLLILKLLPGFLKFFSAN